MDLGDKKEDEDQDEDFLDLLEDILDVRFEEPA